MHGLPYTGSAATAAPITDVFRTTRAALTWTGSVSANWNTTQYNWKNGGLAALYSDGAQVAFDDSGASTNITIQSAGVRPASVTFSNSAKSYTLGGGPIAGTGSVTISG